MQEITFQTLYETHWADVWRLARYLTGDQDLASEIASETFLRAWAGRERVRTETAKAYLLAIARHLVVDHLRRRRGNAVPVEEHHAVAHSAADAGMELERVMEEVRRLPEEFREPLVLTAVNGLSYDEAARVLGIPVALVKVRIYRARLKLAGTKKEGEK
jgi:RNA polymerase sigma-70 factor (ECF subfamily)